MILFSIIVCVFNSKDRIKNTLIHINQLLVPIDSRVEVIIVDNNSTDSTMYEIQEMSKEMKIDLDFKFFFEEKQGLTNARICGIRNSNGQYLIFCDDDNWLHSNYLNVVDDCFKNPNCLIVGGVGIPVTEMELPEWFVEFEGYGYAVGFLNRVNGSHQMVNGAGLAIRRNIAIQYSNLKETLILTDRKGMNLSSGGDNELCIIVGLESVYFNAQLKYYHYLPNSRLSWSYFKKLNYSFGKSEAFLFFYKYIKDKSTFDIFKLFVIDLSMSVKKMNYYFKRRNDNINYFIKFQFYKGYFFSQCNIFFKFLTIVNKARNNFVVK